MESRSQLLNESEAARILDLSTRALQAWRQRGAGPPWVKLGRAVRYNARDLEAYVQEQTQRPDARG